MLDVRLYTRPGCHLCEEVEAVLQALGADYPHRLEQVDIDTDETLRRRYGWVVPVVVVDRRFILATRIDAAMLAAALARATSA